MLLISRIILSALSNGRENNNGALPLHCAAARDQQACVECLVSRFSASVNAQDASGATPLHWASYYGSVASIRCLGSNGADADAVRSADGAVISTAGWGLVFIGVASLDGGFTTGLLGAACGLLGAGLLAI